MTYTCAAALEKLSTPKLREILARFEKDFDLQTVAEIKEELAYRQKREELARDEYFRTR